MKLYESDYVLLRDASAVDRVSMDHCGLEARQRIIALRDAGLLVISSLPIPNSARMSTHYRITQAGRDALAEKLSAEKQMAKKRTRQKNQRAADARQQILNKKQDLRNQFLVAAFSVALTLFVEHFGYIVDLIRNTLEAIMALLH